MADLKRPLTARFTRALAFAANVHRLQARTGTQVPYMAHTLGVAAIALDHGANEEEAIAAVRPAGLGLREPKAKQTFWLGLSIFRALLVIEGAESLCP
jgi:HD domain-containing protein